MEFHVDFAATKLLLQGHTVLSVVAARVPDHHRSGAVLTFGYHALEFGVFERMVLRTDGQMFLGRVHGWALGHRPGYQNPVDRQSEVIMQAAGVVLLDDKDAPTAGPPHPTRRLWRFCEFSLPGIVFGWHSRHSLVVRFVVLLQGSGNLNRHKPVPPNHWISG